MAFVNNKVEKKIGVYYGSKGACSSSMDLSVQVISSYQHIRVYSLF